VIRFTLRGNGPSILVAALSASFGVALLHIGNVLAAVIAVNQRAAESEFASVALRIVAVVFLAIAAYVGAIVTANTFSTIIAGRVRTVALLRLVGATASRQRRAVALQGLVVGVIGAAIGAVAGTIAAMVTTRVAVDAGWIPAPAYGWADPALLIPVVGVVLTTWLASWIGSRRVLSVTPLQALGGAQELSREEAVHRPARTAVAIVLFVAGGVLLALGVVVGLTSPYAVFIGLLGGILSFSGLVLGAHLVMPPALRLVGHLAGRSPSARLAAQNALRYPERSARTTIGLVIGVTLITTFAVGLQSFAQMILTGTEGDPAREQIVTLLNGVQAVFAVLVGFSAVIAAVGLVNNLSLSVLQRTRELGLLRALGFSVKQLRAMVLAESAQLTVTAVLVGLVLGGFYGWVGAQSLLGSAAGGLGIVLPGIPGAVLGVIVVGAAVLTWGAALLPSRRATRVSPVEALAIS
jgi:putative ABC transport system permease protein